MGFKPLYADSVSGRECASANGCEKVESRKRKKAKIK